MRTDNYIILSSFGLTDGNGKRLIRRGLDGVDMKGKSIYLFYGIAFRTKDSLKKVCMELGFQEKNIWIQDEKGANEQVAVCDYIYVGEGDSFEMMRMLKERKLDEVIPGAVVNGATYIGASAGAAVAGMELVGSNTGGNQWIRRYLTSEELVGLGLLEGVVLPHCSKEAVESYVEYKGVDVKANALYSVGDDECLVLDNQGDVVERYVTRLE